MSLIAHILQIEKEGSNIESTIIDAMKIVELSCSHPVFKNKDNDENNPEEEILEKQHSQMEFVYSNGERKHLTTSPNTALRLLNEDGIVLETNDPQKFEEAILFAIAQHGVTFEEIEGEDG